MNVGDRIKKIRKDMDLTLEELADKIGSTRQTIHRYESGEIINIPSDKIESIAKALGVSPAYIMGWDNLKPVTIRNNVDIENEILYLNIPLYAALSCGNGMFVDDEAIEYIQISDRLLNPNKEYFAQEAYGDSMKDENINHGDLLIFEKTQHITNGKVGCFCVDDNIATCKKFYKDDKSNVIMLQPANSKYDPIVVTVEDMGFHVVGKLALVINKRNED